MAAKSATWRVPGVVAEARPLRTTKTNEIWAYMIKVMSLGGTYEIQTRSSGLYGLVGVGSEIVCNGGFEMFQNALRLILDTLEVDGKAFKAGGEKGEHAVDVKTNAVVPAPAQAGAKA